MSEDELKAIEERRVVEPSDVDDLIAEVRRLKMAGYKAADRAWRLTYEHDGDGRSVCCFCGAMQYDYGNGHAPGCHVPVALEEAMAILEAA